MTSYVDEVEQDRRHDEELAAQYETRMTARLARISGSSSRSSIFAQRREAAEARTREHHAARESLVYEPSASTNRRVSQTLRQHGLDAISPIIMSRHPRRRLNFTSPASPSPTDKASILARETYNDFTGYIVDWNASWRPQISPAPIYEETNEHASVPVYASPSPFLQSPGTDSVSEFPVPQWDILPGMEDLDPPPFELVDPEDANIGVFGPG